MMSVKDAVRTVIGYTSIAISDGDGEQMFKGRRKELVLSDYKDYHVTSLDRDRSTLILEVERND